MRIYVGIKTPIIRSVIFFHERLFFEQKKTRVACYTHALYTLVLFNKMAYICMPVQSTNIYLLQHFFFCWVLLLYHYCCVRLMIIKNAQKKLLYALSVVRIDFLLKIKLKNICYNFILLWPNSIKHETDFVEFSNFDEHHR